ncbi:hypothetical protein WJX81_002497 [Elliptochloris bilobata]|uniref:Protein kinase domain-containing protein n=1 Tax=Elliptochloris bilobata TaxID=381761 RepID=A0AAW1QLX9_9CHLO
MVLRAQSRADLPALSHSVAHHAQREIESASCLQHRNIVRLLDVFAHGDQLVLVWELIEGPDLLEFINRCGGQLPEPLAAFYFRQLLDALVAMHARGVVHQDLKPENCMVHLATRTLKVIDFGLSHATDDAAAPCLGTPEYIAPETLVGLEVAGGGGARVAPQAVDIWGAGIVLYMLVAGRYPFQDDEHPRSVAHTLRNIAAGRLRPLPPHVSPACAALVTAALARNPAARPSLAAMAAHPWLTACAPAAAASAALEAELLARCAAAPRHSPRGGKAGSRHAAEPGLAPAAPNLASRRPPRAPGAAADALRRAALGSAAAAQARANGGGCRAQAAAALRCCRSWHGHAPAPEPQASAAAPAKDWAPVPYPAVYAPAAAKAGVATASCLANASSRFEPMFAGLPAAAGADEAPLAPAPLLAPLLAPVPAPHRRRPTLRRRLLRLLFTHRPRSGFLWLPSAKSPAPPQMRAASLENTAAASGGSGPGQAAAGGAGGGLRGGAGQADAGHVSSGTQVWERRALKSRHAKHGWVGVRAHWAHSKLTGDFVASVVAPGPGTPSRIVIGAGFPTREDAARAADRGTIAWGKGKERARTAEVLARATRQLYTRQEERRAMEAALRRGPDAPATGALEHDRVSGQAPPAKQLLAPLARGLVPPPPPSRFAPGHDFAADAARIRRCAQEGRLYQIGGEADDHDAGQPADGQGARAQCGLCQAVGHRVTECPLAAMALERPEAARTVAWQATQLSPPPPPPPRWQRETAPELQRLLAAVRALGDAGAAASPAVAGLMNPAGLLALGVIVDEVLRAQLLVRGAKSSFWIGASATALTTAVTVGVPLALAVGTGHYTAYAAFKTGQALRKAARHGYRGARSFAPLGQGAVSAALDTALLVGQSLGLALWLANARLQYLIDRAERKDWASRRIDHALANATLPVLFKADVRFLWFRKTIGTGAFARVMAATHPTLGALAIKTARRPLDEKFGYEFGGCTADEFRMANMLRGCAQIAEARAYIRMSPYSCSVAFERVTGARTLADIIKARGFPREPIAPADVRKVVVQLARALAFLKQRGIVHLDLKPGNVLITDATNGGAWGVKLIDFGFAATVDPDTHVAVLDRMPGSINYADPCQHVNVPFSHEADMYGLGAITWAMCWLRSSPGFTRLPQVLPRHNDGLHGVLRVTTRLDNPWRRPTPARLLTLLGA